MNTYEILLIFKPNPEFENLEQPVKTVEQHILGLEGELLRCDRIGRKKLAYPIQDLKDGFMAVLGFKLAPAAIKTLSNALKLNEDILRFTILRNEDLDPDKAFVLTPVTAKDVKESARGRAGNRPRRGPHRDDRGEGRGDGGRGDGGGRGGDRPRGDREGRPPRRDMETSRPAAN